MKRSAPHSEGGGGESGGEGDGAPDSKRVKISQSEIGSPRAQLAAKDEDNASLPEVNAAQAATQAAHAATVQSLTPLSVLDVGGQSNFKGRATLTWDAQSGGGTPTHFIIGAIDATTGARLENIAREEGSDAIGCIVVNTAQLTVGRKLRFFVTATVQSAHGVTLFSSASSEPTKPITIDAKDFGAVALNAAALWKSDCAALKKLVATPRDATHGAWSCAQRSGALRSHFVRGLGLARVPRLGKAIKARAPTLLAAIRQVANTASVMRAVLRFAVPQYCTPTRRERRRICRSCHTSDNTVGLARWLSRGVDPNMVDADGDSMPENKGAPLLYIAARQGHVSMIDALLRSGATVDLATADGGRTPLFIAAQNGHTAAVVKLLAAGADVNKATAKHGCTPLWAAAQKGHLTVVTKLIAAGALVNMALTISGATPLYASAHQGHLAVVTKLIAAGAHIDKATTDGGSTPLCVAAQEGHFTVVTKLIAAGALVNKAETDSGCTPLWIAVHEGRLAMVTKLITAGADVNKAETTDGCTPLFMAAADGHAAIVSRLLQRGADKSIRGYKNETPFEVAQRLGYPAIVALLA
tara:strand:- start:72 stop:1823 length:1752 start_codon:yes stop_codon:yes gene_type:complete